MANGEPDLLSNQAHLSAVLETMLDGLVIIDDTAVVQVFNPACERLFGYRADEVVGHNIKMLVPTAHRRRHDGYLKRYRETGEPRVVGSQRELEGQRKDGTVFPIALSLGEAVVEGERYFIGVVHDLTQEVLLRHDATIDSLTGALNRRQFMVRGKDELARSGRYKRPCSVLMFDIDYFKVINDTYGHAAGDQALWRFAAACQEMLRETDFFGRLGGDEFAAILPETDSAGAAILAERMRKRVNKLRVRNDGRRFGFTVSIGVAARDRNGDGKGADKRRKGAASGKGFDDVLALADRALYDAKESGRDKVAVAA